MTEDELKKKVETLENKIKELKEQETNRIAAKEEKKEQEKQKLTENLRISNVYLRRENERLGKINDERKKVNNKRKLSYADRLVHYLGNLIKASFLPLALFAGVHRYEEVIKECFKDLFINKTCTIKWLSYTPRLSWPQSLALIILIIATATVIILTIQAAHDILKDD